MLLTKSEAIQENIAVTLANKNVKPVNYRERNKVKLILIADLVLAAHG